MYIYIYVLEIVCIINGMSSLKGVRGTKPRENQICSFKYFNIFYSNEANQMLL